MGYPPQNRASALTSESMVCRYSEEFLNAGRKHYGMDDRDLTFFTVHMVADQEHTARSAELIARMVKTPREERLVRESAQYMVRIKLGKFDGIYREVQGLNYGFAALRPRSQQIVFAGIRAQGPLKIPRRTSNLHTA
jgi:pyrroloquinoline quinone (PQQ) biosynthesis protein C